MEKLSGEIIAFINNYVQAIKNNRAALFLGAGFSKEAGYFNWKELLRDIAFDLGLDVEKEHDLVAVAQYCKNTHSNRNIIDQTIRNAFSNEKEPTENHRIISQLPISSYWTTNYDRLIEIALEKAHRVVDVKKKDEDLYTAEPNWNAIVYKMHGDVDNVQQTVFVKDDYEKYYREHASFLTALSNDISSKSFLFIGFSFTDPNIDYIFSRVKMDTKGKGPQHYAIIRKIHKEDYDTDSAFEYAKRKFALFTEDLKRSHIDVVQIDEFSQITVILQQISKRMNRNNIFISGSAYEYGDYGEKDAINLIRALSQKLIAQNYNIVSGFGLGVGSDVIAGALEQIYMKEGGKSANRLMLYPFPQRVQDMSKIQEIWAEYRKDMISHAGVSLFLFGNKQKDGEIVLADGIEKEFDIAKEKHNILVPIGCTGYMAERLWHIINDNMDKFYTNINDELREAFAKLNQKTDDEKLVKDIIAFINLFDGRRHEPI